MANSWSSRRGNYDYYVTGDIPRVLRKAQVIVATPATFCRGAVARSSSGAPTGALSRIAVQWNTEGAIRKAIRNLSGCHYAKGCVWSPVDQAARHLGFKDSPHENDWSFDEAHQVLAWALELQNWPTNAQIIRRLRRMVFGPSHDPQTFVSHFYQQKSCNHCLYALLRQATFQCGGDQGDENAATNCLDRHAVEFAFGSADDMFDRGCPRQFRTLLDWAIWDGERGPLRFNSSAETYRQ